MGSLEAHEERMSRFSSQLLEQAFQSKLNVSHNEFSKKNKGKEKAITKRRVNMEKA